MTNIVIQALTGHCFMKAHLFRQNRVSDNKCRLCNEEPEDPDHIIFRCPALARLRNEIFEHEKELNLENLIRFLRNENIQGFFLPPDD